MNKVASLLSKLSSKTVGERLVDIENIPKLWLQTKFYDDFMKNLKKLKVREKQNVYEVFFFTFYFLFEKPII